MEVYDREVFTPWLFNHPKPEPEIKVDYDEIARILNTTKEELENMISIFKCPFRKYDTNGEFKPCLERNCMAFRADDKTFWCAMIEAYGRTPINSKHPIEMLHNGDKDW